MSRTIRALQANKRNKLVKGVSVGVMTINQARASMKVCPILTPSTRIVHVGEVTCRTDMTRKFGRIISTVENLMTVKNFTMDEIKAAISDGSWSVYDE